MRLLISSATMDAEKFSEYFDNAPIFYGTRIRRLSPCIN